MLTLCVKLFTGGLEQFEKQVNKNSVLPCTEFLHFIQFK